MRCEGIKNDIGNGDRCLQKSESVCPKCGWALCGQCFARHEQDPEDGTWQARDAAKQKDKTR